MPINFHYAIQSCDTASWQGQPRYCGDDRTLLSKKSIKSFLNCVENAANYHTDSQHTIVIFTDNISTDLKTYLEKLHPKYSNIKIDIQHKQDLGIADSIETCYRWLDENGVDFVYQIQDDYIFRPYALIDMINTWYRIFNENKGTQCIVKPYNDPHNWLSVYRNKQTPRTIFFGDHSYYIQIYDLSCSFLWTRSEFVKHWDLYEKFFELTRIRSHELESASLNKMLVNRGILAVSPIISLSLHMQSEIEKDPYIDWKSWWNDIIID